MIAALLCLSSRGASRYVSRSPRASSCPRLTVLAGTTSGIQLLFVFHLAFMAPSSSSSSEEYVTASSPNPGTDFDRLQAVAILYMSIQTLYASYFVNVMLRCVFGHKWTDVPNRTRAIEVVQFCYRKLIFRFQIFRRQRVSPLPN